MSYIGDIRLGDTFDTKFTTRQISGAPSTLSSSPVISAYVDNSTTQITAGITLSVDFDSVTGLNNVRVVASGGNGFAAGSNYQLVITTGTVNSVSVVGEVIAEFSIEARSALMPTTAGRKLDVSAGGEAGIDWANVGSPTTTLALTGTTIASTQKVDIETIKTNPVVNGGTVTFPTNATLASTTNITAGTITTATNLTNAPTAGDFTATMKTSLNAATPSVTVSDKTGFSLTAAYDAAKTAAQAGDAMTLTSGERNAVADAILGRNVAGGSSAGRLVKEALYVLRNKTDITAGTLTVFGTDDSTTAFTATVTTTAGNPISQIDPA